MTADSVGADGASSQPHVIDSSFWIPVLRPGARGQQLAPRPAGLLTAGLAVTTDVVVMELLRGARDEADYQRLQARLAPLPRLPVTPDRWDEAARLGFDLRRQHGITVASTDLLIAAVAIAHGATLVHRDDHFNLIAAHTPLNVESHA